MLVANLRQHAPVDINDLPDDEGIASARFTFDRVMLFPSGLLTHEECDRLRPRVHQTVARDRIDAETASETRVGDVRFIKTHDCWDYTIDGEPLLGGRSGAEGAILIVRDPRDVAPSMAHHRAQTIDQSIDFMSDPEAGFCDRRDRQPNQLRQRLRRWSDYNAGWLDQREIPVHLVRYEDMQADPANAFRRALAFAGVDISAAEAEQAARFADFGELRKQEAEHGFREAPLVLSTGGFFRRGIAGAWLDELTSDQVARLEADHAPMMARLGYDISATNQRIVR